LFNAKLKPIETSEERGARRFRLLLHASAELGGSSLVDIVIHDLSSTGFLIECPDALGAHAEVTLELPGAGSVVGDVVWASGNFYGGEFRTRLDRAALDAARTSSTVIWPEFTPKSAADRIAETSETLRLAEHEPQPEPIASVADNRLPVARRMQIITGASLLLWMPVALGAWIVFF
jgi:hypothetical protein